MYMTQGVRRAAKLTPDDVAFMSDERSLTHGQFEAAVAGWAGALPRNSSITSSVRALRTIWNAQPDSLAEW